LKDEFDVGSEIGSSSNTITVRGVVSSGIGESRLFTELPWVKKQFIEKLGINPCPGTFNVTIYGKDRKKLEKIRRAEGVQIVPEDVNYCSGKAFNVRINDRVSGAAIIPLVSGYPEDKLEIISSEHLKQHFSLKNGDEVEVTIFP
jgi:riboflavin kinase